MLCCTIAAIGLHLGSIHADPAGLNNFNPGVYVRMDSGLTAGVYRNSINKPSVYAGWTFEADSLNVESLQVVPAVTVGAVSGYPTSPLPMVAFSLAFGKVNSDVAFRIAYIPKYEKGSHVVHFMLERKF